MKSNFQRIRIPHPRPALTIYCLLLERVHYMYMYLITPILFRSVSLPICFVFDVVHRANYPIFYRLQWLVKKAIETREEMGDYIREFSVSQFNKNHSTPQVRL